MKKIISSLLVVMATIALFACGGTEIEKNPAPIVWGDITFFPDTIERSRGKTVWNKVRFTGYGKSGTIEKVTITDDETVVDNINSDFYTAKKQVWKGVSGDYQQALAVIMNNSYKNPAGMSGWPQFKVNSYTGTDETWKDNKNSISIASSKGKDISFRGYSSWECTDVAVNGYAQFPLKIAKVSVGKFFIPDNFEKTPKDLILKDFNLTDISVPGMNIKVQKCYVNYEQQKLKFALDDASVPGATLALAGITNAPEIIKGSIKGQGEVKDNFVNAEATADLPNLFDLSVELSSSLSARDPDLVKFVLKDDGVLNYLTNEQKSQLAMLALAVPNGQEAIIGFLTKPNQTLSGTIDLRNGRKDFSFSVR